MTKPVNRPHLKPGRKPKNAPGDAADQLKELAAAGWSLLGIAKHLGTSKETLRRWMTEDDKLQEAFDWGREQERQTLHQALVDAAKGDKPKGNITAAIFLLKARHGYREGDQADVGNRVSINFTLPAAQPMEMFKVIDRANPADRAEPLPAQRLIAARGT